jgi:hypothetical protein
MNLPTIRVKTLADAKAEMAKFGITAKVSSLFLAKRLLREKARGNGSGDED